ncbi:hypothetical protein O181_061705 [Austropuccinia psidii MF-1]|uniref:proteasome endopeptidase complex n=1 Tax=Austropuccinia psidii MF-1 TaxID=1389203 RepID=A0A9Q3EMX5_9BASI|nr:hypothetical protein [Austropuccinia psidii MF-1]
MTSSEVENYPLGFDFSNHLRNSYLTSRSGPSKLSLPKATSTGTTIVGLVWSGGVCLGADTRATEGPIVADKNCEKIHFISDNIRCCGAGTAADTEFVTAMISSNIQLHALNSGRQPRVVTAMTMLKQHLYKYQGHVGAALVIGGVDPTGPHLFTVAPHGSTDKLPYVTMGSGSLAAMAVFESKWKPNLSREEAIDLVVQAIFAGIFNDLGSGSNCDVCVIEAKGTEMLRNYAMPNERAPKELSYKMRRGTTAWIKQDIKKLVVSETVTQIGSGTADGGPETGASAAEGMELDK